MGRDVAASVGSNVDLVTVAMKNASRRALRSLTSDSATEVEATVASPTAEEGPKILATVKQGLSLPMVEKSLAQEGVSLEVTAIESDAPEESEGEGDEQEENEENEGDDEDELKRLNSAATIVGASAFGV